MFYKNTSSRSTLSSGTSFRARFFAVLFAPHTTMPTPDFLNGIPGPPASTKDWGLPSTGKEWCIPCIETEHIQPALNYGSLLPHGFSPLHQVAKTTIRPRMGLPCTPRTSAPRYDFSIGVRTIFERGTTIIPPQHIRRHRVQSRETTCDVMCTHTRKGN